MRIALVAFVVLSCFAGRAAAESIFLDRVCRAEVADTYNRGDVRDWRGVNKACCDQDGDNPYQASSVLILGSTLISQGPAVVCAAGYDAPENWLHVIARDGGTATARNSPDDPDFTAIVLGLPFSGASIWQTIEFVCRGNDFVAVLYDCPCGATEDGRACRQQQPTDRPRQVLPGQNIPRPELVPQPQAPTRGGVPVPGTPMPIPPRPRTQ